MLSVLEVGKPLHAGKGVGARERDEGVTGF